jgi:hypothetical protein
MTMLAPAAAREPAAHPAERSVPPPLAASPLMRAGGYEVYRGLLDPRGYLELMLAEALAGREAAEEHAVDGSDGTEGRGGVPARRFLSASGGPVQDAFYAAPWMTEMLSERAGAPVTPTSSRGTYTYYARPGDHLALHLDVELCDIAVITCLHTRLPTAGHGGVLRLWPGCTEEPLSAVAAGGERGSVDLWLGRGDTVALFGGFVPHQVLPIEGTQSRIVSVLCYTAHP